ncbi:uncharacterized protein [Euwallacea fornicatus]|uniref:uncharacterized protein isoform X1 n=1 Tax=Euwallacea fornicatus TaxID=995702 RepID=UPI00338DE6B8
MSNNRTHLLVQLFLLNNVKMDDDPLPEPTVAPFNSHPVDVDMSVIPIETVKLTSIDDVLVKPPPDVQKLFNEVFHFSNSTTVLPSTISSINENLTNSTQGTLKLTIGKTVEIIQDITTESSNLGLNNTTLNGKVNYDPAQVNLYTILALVLVIVTLICFGIIMWCRKNKLRTEKRNQYPVFSVTNSEYISPKSLNNEKIKNVP